MRLACLALAVLALSCSGGGGGRGSCCTPTVVSRNFGYVGTYSSDGGVSTQVQLVVSASGESELRFVRGGEQISERFSTAILPE